MPEWRSESWSEREDGGCLQGERRWSGHEEGARPGDFGPDMCCSNAGDHHSRDCSPILNT